MRFGGLLAEFVDRVSFDVSIINDWFFAIIRGLIGPGKYHCIFNVVSRRTFYTLTARRSCSIILCEDITYV